MKLLQAAWRSAPGHTPRAMEHQVRRLMHTASSDHLIDLADRYAAGNYEAPGRFVLSRGQGARVWDRDGREYIDFLSGYSALNHGHNHPDIVAAAVRQMTQGVTTTSRAFNHDQLGPWAAKICQMAGKDKVLPMNTGAEGVETAMKAAERWAKLHKGLGENEGTLVFAEQNFHGRTTAVVGASSDPETYAGFGPYATDRYRKVPFNNVAALEALFRREGEKIAAFIVEPIQGEAGIIIPSDDYLPRVQELCKKHNVLLAVDEVQTGMGRTGKLFAHQHYSGVNPDIIIFGKAAGGGIVPVSGILANNDVMRVFTPGSHGSTFGGGPIQCAVGLAALEVLEKEGLVERSAELGQYFLDILKEELRPFHGSERMIRDIRGKGLFIGIEFAESAKPVCKAMIGQGFLCKATHDTTIRVAPPLIISKEDIEKFTMTLKSVVAEKEKAQGKEGEPVAVQTKAKTFAALVEEERTKTKVSSGVSIP